MIKFIKNLFKKFDPNSPKYIQELHARNGRQISEPVISFVQCVKNDRKRFDVKDNYHYGIHDSGGYYVTDKKIGKIFYIYYKKTFQGMRMYYTNCKFLTDDEREYVIKELNNFYSSLWHRKASFHGRHKEKRLQRERQRLIDIYCVGN